LVAGLGPHDNMFGLSGTPCKTYDTARSSAITGHTLANGANLGVLIGRI
jgi:hypothetical protein